MTVRSMRYPLDVSVRYPEDDLPVLPQFVRAPDRIHGLFTNPDTGDLTNELLYRLIHKTLAYCDLIDLAQEAAEKNADARLTAVMDEVGALRTSVDTLIAFFGVIIPAWTNKKEVENGDDMGIVHKSAAELGLIVTFASVQQEPGFGHEDVVAIDPPAGSLIPRGSPVRVTLNLEG